MLLWCKLFSLSADTYVNFLSLDHLGSNPLLLLNFRNWNNIQKINITKLNLMDLILFPAISTWVSWCMFSTFSFANIYQHRRALGKTLIFKNNESVTFGLMWNSDKLRLQFRSPSKINELVFKLLFPWASELLPLCVNFSLSFQFAPTSLCGRLVWSMSVLGCSRCPFWFIMFCKNNLFISLFLFITEMI